MKHTPGPWNYRHRYFEGNRENAPVDTFAITADMGNITIAETSGSSNADAANAIAISALPQLLAVVRLAVDSQEWNGNDPNDDRWTHFYLRANAAIAAAEGGK